MSLLLCRQESVTNPYYVEDLGIHLYSSQELCYVIYHHPLMAMEEGFLDERLLAFIRKELDMEFLAARLEKWRGSGDNGDEMLSIILQECNYYGAAQISRFRQQVASYRKLSPAEFAKARADFLFGNNQFGKAAAYYEKILELPGDRRRQIDDFFLGRVWNNLGASYARMFQFAKAAGAFGSAYMLTKDLSILERLFHLTELDPGLELEERFRGLIDEEMRRRWAERAEQAKKEAEESEEVRRLEELFGKDPVKRMAGAEAMVRGWKQEYRNMI